MEESSPRQFSLVLASVAIVLTLIAGYIDAIGYLNLGHVYVANMSGNSIAVGIHAANRQPLQLWRYAWPVVSFTSGVFVSRIVVTLFIHAGMRSVAAPAMALEALALAGFMAVPAGVVGVFLAASAMGIQAATLSRFNGTTVYTCFVTGSLVKFAENGADALVRRMKRQPSEHGRRFVWFGLAWLAYVFGAALGAIALYELTHVSVLIAVACLIALIVGDLVWPARIDETVQYPIPATELGE